MSSLFSTGTQGTVIALLATEGFQSWLAAQTTHAQTWVNAAGYQGKGLCLIPNAEGQLSQVVYGVDDLNDHFACGDLVKQLPEGQYRIDGDEALQKRVAFAWGVGAYSFNRYKDHSKPLPTLVLPSEAFKALVESEISD